MSTEKAREASEAVGRETKNYPTWLFDPGHGGIIDGEYQTSGKRSPEWEDGRILYEGEFNRAVVKRVEAMMDNAGYPYKNVVNSEEDVPLKVRTDIANDFYNNVSKDCIYLSFHANAGGGTGKEVFTSEGQTKSDPIADVIIEKLHAATPGLRLRKDTKDGDHDKEAQFWVLRKTLMPSILIEFAFMDTLDPDCEMLMSEEWRDTFAEAVFEAIIEINENY